MQTEHKILIVGAGPTGLYMANECQRYGLAFDIIDKKDNLSIHSKALGLHARTLLLLTQAGLIEPVLQQGLILTATQANIDHKILFKIDLANIDCLYPQIVILPQNKFEKILYDNLFKNNRTVQWQTELTSIKSTTANIQVTLSHNNQLETREYFWVIACDGAHSTLRHAVNYQFSGGQYNNTWWLADLKMQTTLPLDRLSVYFGATGVCACFPISDQWYRLVVIRPENYNGALSLEAFTAEAKKYITAEFTVQETAWLNEFHVSHRLIEHYQYNHIFFAGDAAHIHSPIGGQGLNTGLQDIQNLIWKLALVQQKKAKLVLLTSYETERMAVGKMVLQETDAMTQMLLLNSDWKKSLRNFLLPLITSIKPLNKAIAMQMAQLTIHYQKNSFIQQRGHTGLIHAGKLLPNFYLYDIQQNKHNIFTLLTATKHYLLVFCPQQKHLFEAIALANIIAEKYQADIECYLILPEAKTTAINFFLDPALAAHAQLKLSRSAAVLVRPDQYIGYCQTGLAKTGLLAYLRRVFI